MYLTTKKTALALLLCAATLSAVQDDNLLFIGVDVGAGSTKNSLTGAVPLQKVPQNTGTALGGEIGINWNDYLFSTLNYQAGLMNTTNLNNVYATFNGKTSYFNGVAPYAGILLGYSNLHWNDNPIAYTSRDTDSNSFLIGFQAGIETRLSDMVSVLLSYKYEGLFHKTDLYANGNSGTIDTNSFQSFNVGLRFYIF